MVSLKSALYCGDFLVISFISAIILIGDRMYCIHCGKEFYKRKHLFTLFQTEREMICPSCLKYNQPMPKIVRIQVEEADVFVYSLCENQFSFWVYFEDYNQTYSYLRRRYPDAFIVLCDKFLLNDQTYNALLYHHLANPDKMLIVLCYSMRN